MKIAFTGDSTSGQFYPIIAIAQRVYEQAEERHLVHPTLFYLATKEYNPVLLFNNQIKYIKVPGSAVEYGKSIGILQYLRSFFSIIKSFLTLFRLFPDVVLSKGGAECFPVLTAARMLGIPIMIHETDTVPSQSNIWASKFAQRIGTAYKSTTVSFPEEKTAYVGQPIRKEIEYPLSEGAREYLHLEPDLPTILVLGGTEEGGVINNTIINSLTLLLDRYQVIHQTGKEDIAAMRSLSSVVLKDTPFSSRYHPFSYLDDLAIRMAAGSAEVAISQAGSVMFELASWGIPAIVVPVTKSSDDHQRKNAFAYARLGGAEVIEEANLTPHILAGEINRLIENPKARDEMKIGAQEFNQRDAATKIANGLLDIALTHEK